MTPEFMTKIRSLIAATAACAFACSAVAADAPDKAKPAPPAHPNGPDAAAADVAKMTVPAGMQSTLFASEPMVVNPAAVEMQDLRTVAGALWQRVRITDQKGQGFLLDYQMIEGPEGWLINAVQMQRAPDVGA